jgi:hypothetical protein
MNLEQQWVADINLAVNSAGTWHHIIARGLSIDGARVNILNCLGSGIWPIVGWSEMQADTDIV